MTIVELQEQGRRRGALVERDRELALLDAQREAASAGRGSLVMLEGAAGAGKTALLEHAVEAAQAAGMRPLTSRGRELERTLSFGIVRQLLEPPLLGAPAAERDRLLDGPAVVAGDLLEGRDVGARGRDELELIHGLHWLAVNLSDPAPLTVVVDDLQWADRSSLAFLAYLAQRLHELPIALVVSVRSGEPGGPDDLIIRLVSSPDAHVVHVPPLSPTGTEVLVRRAFPDADAEFCRICSASSGGNPFLAEEMLKAAEAEGLTPDGHGARRAAELASDSVVRWTLVRLERLPAGARELAEAVAVLGDGARLRVAAALAGSAPEAAAAAADALAAADMLAGGEPLQFVHPLIRAAVYDQIAPASRSERHRAAARLLADDGVGAEGVAAQLLVATPVGDPWAVEQLRAASQVALGRGAAESAQGYLARAAEEPPPVDERGRVLVEAAQAQALIGDPEAIDRMRSAIAVLTDPRERAEAFYRFGWMLYNTGQLSSAVDAFAGGLGEWPRRDDELSVRLHTAHVAMRSITSMDAEALRAHASDGVTSAASDAAGREILTRLAMLRVFSGDDAAGATELATRALGGGAMVAEDGVTLSFAVAASCLIWSDALDAADEAIEAALADCRRRGAYAGAAYVMFGRSWVRLRRGQASEAAADAGVAIDAWRGGWGGQIPLARYWHAWALMELGRLDEAHAVVYEPGADEEAQEDTYAAYLAEARARLALARGDVALARRELRTVEEVAKSIPVFHNPNVQPWRFQAGIAAARAGDRDEAERLVAEGLATARRFGAPRGIGMGLRALGIIEGGTRGIELLEEAARVLETSPATLERIRVLVDLGSLLRRARRAGDAREPLRQALDLASVTGAVALRERARAELAAAGARPRRERLSGAQALTPSERRIAALAAEGRSNPQIAQELFLTRKTVEGHLSAAYRKLGVRSRADLPAALRD